MGWRSGFSESGNAEQPVELASAAFPTLVIPEAPPCSLAPPNDMGDVISQECRHGPVWLDNGTGTLTLNGAAVNKTLVTCPYDRHACQNPGLGILNLDVLEQSDLRKQRQTCPISASTIEKI
jgi:hypothetical protein